MKNYKKYTYKCKDCGVVKPTAKKDFRPVRCYDCNKKVLNTGGWW